jgi:hypothetical protein
MFFSFWHHLRRIVFVAAPPVRALPSRLSGIHFHWPPSYWCDFDTQYYVDMPNRVQNTNEDFITIRILLPLGFYYHFEILLL